MNLCERDRSEPALKSESRQIRNPKKTLSTVKFTGIVTGASEGIFMFACDTSHHPGDRRGRTPDRRTHRSHQASFMTILRLLARQTRLPGATDHTRYGEGRASPRYPPAASSRTTLPTSPPPGAIQAADAQTILNAASYGSRMGSCKVCVFCTSGGS